MVPVELSNFLGFADGTARYINRPGGRIQQFFWNGYYHQHCLIYLGINFPDGMQVIELPHPGYFTDIMSWNISDMSRDLTIINQLRVLQGLIRLIVYGDKIFNTDKNITAAYSLRHGPLSMWMTVYNAVMSPIRAGVEWSFGKIITRATHADYRQKLRESPIKKNYTVAVFMANCHTCMYGSQHTPFFELTPPTLEEYCAQ